jgi:TRAP-type C4-dicarboxylate transport system substrate-binding protein
MSIYDAYQGLDSGLLDCSQGYSYAVGALNQQEVMDSYTMLNWGQVGALGIFMNKDAYDSLPEDQQQALMEAGEGLSDEFGRLVNADNDAAVEKMREAGVEIIELPEEERAKLVEKGNTYLEEWSAQADAAGLDGQALLEEYRGLIDKYQAEVEAEGYPWERG